MRVVPSCRKVGSLKRFMGSAGRRLVAELNVVKDTRMKIDMSRMYGAISRN